MEVRTEPCALEWAVNGSEHRCGQPVGHAEPDTHYCSLHFACWPMWNGGVILHEFGDLEP